MQMTEKKRARMMGWLKNMMATSKMEANELTHSLCVLADDFPIDDVRNQILMEAAMRLEEVPPKSINEIDSVLSEWITIGSTIFGTVHPLVQRTMTLVAEINE